MHAYLFIGGDSEKRKKKALTYAKRGGAKIYEFPLAKIDDVRNLAYFTKFSQNTPISILIENVELATKEALNAFLKNLEEPGKNISFILTCSNEQALLPTIISRCQVIRIGGSSLNTDPSISSDFLKMSLGQKLKSLEKLKKREDAKNHLEKLILSAHKNMISKKGIIKKETYLIKTAQRIIYNLNLNANVSLQMTYFAKNINQDIVYKEGLFKV